jgi:hypothetical protein
VFSEASDVYAFGVVLFEIFMAFEVRFIEDVSPWRALDATGVRDAVLTRRK